MRLYELTSDLMELNDLLEQGEDVEEIREIIMTHIASKAGGLMELILNIESDAEAVRMEIKRLERLLEVKENKTKRLKEYLMDCMTQADIKSVPSAKGNITIRNNQPKIVIDDEDKIPAGFKTVKEVTSINKKDLKESLKNGQRVEGCHLEASRSLVIK